MAIEPISIPDAAGLNYGENDVRHFSEGDAMDVPGMSNPTRQLAQRDVAIAQKLNEVVETVNNKEQFVPLPILRTVLSPSAEEVVTNYRIPFGFEARVLNATVTSNPPSASAELDIYYGTGFGGTTGEVLVSTSSEATGGTVFKSQGEMIVVLKNKGGQALEMVASIILTMRPVGSTGGVLISAPPPATVGPPGQQGIPGNPGVGLPGSPGSAGMVWSGQWSSLVSYTASQVVSFAPNGTNTSSYIALALTAPGESPSSVPAKWDTVAAAGANGSGAPGPAGAPGGGDVTTAINVVSFSLVTGADWQSGTLGGYVGPGISSSGMYPQPITETKVNASTGTLSFLLGSLRAVWLGAGTLTLPTVTGGASVDYTNSFIHCTAALNGSQANIATLAFNGTGVTCIPVGSNTYAIKVSASTPQAVAVNIFGCQLG